MPAKAIDLYLLPHLYDIKKKHYFINVFLFFIKLWYYKNVRGGVTMIGFIFWIIPIIIFWIKTDQIIKAIKENTSKIAETKEDTNNDNKNIK